MWTNDSRVYWIWLAQLFGQGSTLAAKLAQRYSSAQAIYEGAADNLKADDVFTEQEVCKIKKYLKKRTLTFALDILSRCESKKIAVITPEDDCFPAPLRSLTDMPLVLYVLGDLPDCSNNMLCAAVGTRTMTDYGRTVAYSLGMGLAFGGAVVVSGMALGADSMALIGALDAGGQVIAILGSGVDVIYPADHKEIYRKILKRGAIISEYPPSTRPYGGNFPVRNRLMSGISDATVVIEAGATSGAMITAKHAIVQGKRLFAVPGKIGDEGSEGTNLLLREGAMPVISAEDILCEFEFIYHGRISVDAAHNALRSIDADTVSRNAMSRMRIGTAKTVQNEDKNYYGKGSYGGRAGGKKFGSSPQKAEAQTVPSVDADEQKNEGLKTERKSASSSNIVAEKVSVVAEQGKKATKGKKKSAGGLFFGKKDVKESVQDYKEEKTDKKLIPAKKIELDLLDESEIKVYNKMKPDVPMLPDELVDEKTSVSDIMSALTMLEMAGAVEAGGGGYFIRVSPDDIMQSIND